MRVGGITDMSTVDWYGNISLVMFFAGCNLRCPYCQNSGLIPLNSGTEVDINYLEDRIETALKPVPQLDAVVFTGGEPLIQPDAVIEAAKIVKRHKLKLMLDTNGTIFDAVEKVLLAGLVDRIALDVKAPINGKDYGIVSGVPLFGERFSDSVKNTLKLCNEIGIEVEARTTVAPGLSDDIDFIRAIANDIKGLITVYYLQQFDNQGEVLSAELKNREPLKRELMLSLARHALEAGVEPVFIKTRFEGLERVYLQ
jgi:pyruvate formate lyase activating enzyme